MRSMSDRRVRVSNDTLHFKDTTALRTKQHRVSPQQIFQKPTILACQRPTCPPPKLPDNQSTIPLRPPRQQSNIMFFNEKLLDIN